LYSYYITLYCNECQINVILKIFKSCYGTSVSLAQPSSSSHLTTANSAHCKSLLYTTRCPNFAMWHCFVLYFKECPTCQPFFYITLHFDNNDTNSYVPSSYVPDFVEDNTTEKVNEHFSTLCNVSGIYALLFNTR